MGRGSYCVGYLGSHFVQKRDSPLVFIEALVKKKAFHGECPTDKVSCQHAPGHRDYYPTFAILQVPTPCLESCKEGMGQG